MKYDKQLFINNLTYLTRYDYEPEVTVKLKNHDTIFIVAYKDFVDITTGESTVKLAKVEEILDYINFDNVVKMECDTINLQLPVQSQSIVVDGKLCINAYPTELVQKHKKQIKLFRIITLPCLIAVFTYFIITILNCDTFDTSAIVACSVLGGVFVVCSVFFTIFDTKRNKLLKQYFDPVSEEDRLLANELLRKVKILDRCEYEFYSIFRFDLDDVGIQQTLKLLSKGNRIYVDIFNTLKMIEQELLTNNTDNKYNDLEINNYISDVANLLERNLCDI